MRPNHEKEEQHGLKKPQFKRRQSDSSDLGNLRTQLRTLTMQVKEQQSQLAAISLRCRQEGLRNQKLKKEVGEADDKIQLYVQKQTQFYLQKYKNNKDSPLFYNQNGLSPMELLKIGDKKYEGISQGNICMVCFMDLQKNTKILELPCAHMVHKECGIQHLLYSPNCPACSKNLKQL